MHGLYGWRGAFLGAAALGAMAALVLLFTPGGEAHHPAGKTPAASAGPTNWRLLLTAPILMNFLFFTIYAFGSFGLQNFSVVALGSLYGTSPVTAKNSRRDVPVKRVPLMLCLLGCRAQHTADRALPTLHHTFLLHCQVERRRLELPTSSLQSWHSTN